MKSEIIVRGAFVTYLLVSVLFPTAFALANGHPGDLIQVPTLIFFMLIAGVWILLPTLILLVLTSYLFARMGWVLRAWTVPPFFAGSAVILMILLGAVRMSEASYLIAAGFVGFITGIIFWLAAFGRTKRVQFGQ